MEAIKQTVRTPKSHEIRIKIPDHIPENDPVEIIIVFKKKSDSFVDKIDELKNAMSDKLFLRDLTEIFENYENIDLEEWQDQRLHSNGIFSLPTSIQSSVLNRVKPARF